MQTMSAYATGWRISCSTPSFFIGVFRSEKTAVPCLVSASGALGAGLALFSRYPIMETSIHPYSLNGSPIDVASGDWFVGKSAASTVIDHPTLGEVEVFNTHASPPSPSRLVFLI